MKLEAVSPSKPKETTAIRKRTKTGCLTCRKRKKKCDENVIDGKCQGCTRNFLECCWLEPKCSEAATLATPPVSVVSSPKMAVKIISSPSNMSPKYIPQPANAYPSPVNSPELQGAKLLNAEISTLELSKNKVSKPKRKVIKMAPKFVVTSFDKDKALVHVK